MMHFKKQIQAETEVYEESWPGSQYLNFGFVKTSVFTGKL